MKVQSLLCSLTLLSSLSIHANGLRSFCQQVKKEVAQSKETLRNNGSISITNVDGESVRESYRGCRHDIPWMKEVRQTICENTTAVYLSDLKALNVPKSIYFVFDGAADFNARAAMRIDPTIANLDGSEPSDLGIGNFNSGGFWLSTIKEMQEETGESYHVQYHASSGFQEREGIGQARGCLKQIDSYIDILNSFGAGFNPKLFGFGYSNGARDILSLQEHGSRETGRNFDLVFTLDPIVKAGGFLFKRNDTYVGQKSSSTSRLINFYQTTDKGSLNLPLLGRLILNGKPVAGADINYHMDKRMKIYTDFVTRGFDDNGNLIQDIRSFVSESLPGHLSLMHDDRLDATLRCEIDAVKFGTSTESCMDSFHNTDDFFAIQENY